MNILKKVGTSVISRDCSKRYTCKGPQKHVEIEDLRKCSKDATCQGNKENVPTCVCKLGFEGDGYDCKAGKFFLYW